MERGGDVLLEVVGGDGKATSGDDAVERTDRVTQPGHPPRIG